MNPLSAIYAAGSRFRNLLYDRGIIESKRLQGPVISVGNISVGGSGKTPFVLLLGEMLKGRGIAFDILSRGYGRATRGVLMVEPGGASHDFGDEPLLMARRLGVPVVIGEDRHAAGVFAESRFGPQVHLLDDGFQHRALARDFDIVLVTPDDARDAVLPAGRLREPLSALSRADAIVLTAGAEAKQFPIEGNTVWRVRRGIVAEGYPERPVVFCGIARPRNFLAQLRTAGVEPVAEAFFRDHHRYSESDIRDLQRVAQESGAGGFITTEKDAINLGAYLGSLQPLTVVRVKMSLVDGDRALDSMLATTAYRRRARERIAVLP
jgi:tetraacyldisaccharide 4'-kinase